MKIRPWLAAGLLALMVIPGSVAHAEEWRRTFTVEGALAPAAADDGEDGTSLLAFGRLRLGARISRGRGLTLEIGSELNALAGPEIFGLAGLPRASTLRLWDFAPELHSGENLRIGHNLDRLSVAVRVGDAVLRVGRQAISHGSGRFFSPTDLFSPTSPYAAFTEYRAGVDALRISKPFGERLETEAIAVGQEDSLRKGLLLGRAHALLPGVDLSFLAGSAFGEPMCALDASGDWGGAGWYGEAVARLGGERAPVLRAMAGISYRFELGLTVTAEVFENGLGQAHREDYSRAIETPEALNGQSFYLARHYSAMHLSYEITPLVRGETVWIQNYDDGSALLLPRVVWDAGGSITVSAAALVPVGPGTPADVQSPGAWPSELGILPTVALVEGKFAY